MNFTPAKMLLFHVLCASVVSCLAVSGVLIDGSGGWGRVFDGIGGISGGGATSKLLVNYPEPQRNQILDFLFKPNFGASLQILKVEIGGDAQSTDGGESSHMHEPWDEDYHRGYEWWLMKEAKKRNPSIKLAALCWAFPGWLGFGFSTPYTRPAALADYVTRWLVAARDVHNLTVDYIGIWNEKPYNVGYVKVLRHALDQRHLADVRIVVADGDWSVVDDVTKDTVFAKAVDVIGVHYPGTTSTDEAVKTGKALWSSEDYSTFNDNVGAGCWARILNQNYVNGLMTSTISWNLIASYYSSLPFGRDGLMTASEPWTGHYTVNNPIWITAHTTQFTDVGWRYLPHGAGVGLLDKGGSYVTLYDVTSGHMTMVIEKMSHDHSVCIRPPLPPYDTATETKTFTLAPQFSHIKQFIVWYSRLGYGGQKEEVFGKKTAVKVVNSSFTVSIEPDTVMTLTTLDRGNKGVYPKPPPSAPFPLPYSDSFDGYTVPAEAYNLASQIGMFETVHVTSTSHHGYHFGRHGNDAGRYGNGARLHGNVLRQKVLTRAIDWCGVPLIDVMVTPVALIGNFSWSDVSVSADILVHSVNGSRGAFLGTRVDRGGCGVFAAKGVFFALLPSNGKIVITGDLAATKLLASASYKLSTDTWYNVKLQTKGAKAAVSINGHVVLNADVSSAPKHGFVGLGTPNFGYADFDNLAIDRAT